MSAPPQYCYVCRKSEPNMHELNLVHQRVGLGSIETIVVCSKHYEAYKQGKNLVEIEKRNFTRFITKLNHGVCDDYE